MSHILTRCDLIAYLTKLGINQTPNQNCPNSDLIKVLKIEMKVKTGKQEGDNNAIIGWDNMVGVLDKDDDRIRSQKN